MISFDNRIMLHILSKTTYHRSALPLALARTLNSQLSTFNLFYNDFSYATVLIFHDVNAVLRLADALSADVIACRFLSS